jgi:hypothetical protein
MRLFLSVLIPTVFGTTKSPLKIQLPEIVGTFIPQLPPLSGIRRVGGMSDLSSSSDSTITTSLDVVTPLSPRVSKSKRLRATLTNGPTVEESVELFPKSVDSTASSDFGFFVHPPRSIPDDSLSEGFGEKLSLIHPDHLTAAPPTEEPEQVKARSDVRKDIKSFLTVDGRLFDNWRLFLLHNAYTEMWVGTDPSTHSFEHIFRLMNSFLFQGNVESIAKSVGCVSTNEVVALNRSLIMLQIVKDIGFLNGFRFRPEPLFSITTRKDGRLSKTQTEKFFVMDFSSEIALRGGPVFRLIKQIAQDERVRVGRLTELIGLSGYRNHLDWFSWLYRRDFFDSMQLFRA